MQQDQLQCSKWSIGQCTTWCCQNMATTRHQLDWQNVTELLLDNCVWPAICFSQGYSLYFFLIFAHLWWFGVFGFRIGILGLGACGVEPSGFFWGWGALYKYRRITLGKNFVSGQSACFTSNPCYSNQWVGATLLNAAITSVTPYL